MSERCFVIQPFDDGGPFDKRYDDLLVPAIKAAELDPYRVDRDPIVEIPIDQIETGVASSDICLADITRDNPNVWFELGYAIALAKPVVLICSENREPPFPFDVQHRTITRYKSESSRDFAELQEKITERLTALRSKAAERKPAGAISPVSLTQGLARSEVAALLCVMENGGVYNRPVSTDRILTIMRKEQFLSNIAVAMALDWLVHREFLSLVEIPTDFEFTEPGYGVTEAGRKWLRDNENTLNLLDAPPF
jgi:hypothetical protein